MAALTDYSRFKETYKKKSRKKKRFFLLLIFSILIIVFINRNFLTDKKEISKVVPPITKEILGKGVSILNPDVNSVAIEQIVQKELEGTKGSYGIVIKNLKTGERYYFNEHKVFESASLYKLFVMATVFQEIQRGELAKNDILTNKISVLNTKFRISSDSAELKEGSITLPVQSALQRMITISDNYSALLLTEEIRLSKVATFLNQNSLTESKVGTRGESPTTSAMDISLFFQKLHNEELAGKASTLDMITLLKDQKLNSKIPKYLPQDVTVSHKTGELGLFSHDGGIVSTAKGDFIIVVLTETNNPSIANEKISNISKNVYEYFTR